MASWESVSSLCWASFHHYPYFPVHYLHTWKHMESMEAIPSLFIQQNMSISLLTHLQNKTTRSELFSDWEQDPLNSVSKTEQFSLADPAWKFCIKPGQTSSTSRVSSWLKSKWKSAGIALPNKLQLSHKHSIHIWNRSHLNTNLPVK